jgi:hypothetical protein
VEDVEADMRAHGFEGDVFTHNIQLQYLLAVDPEKGLSYFAELRALKRGLSSRYGIQVAPVVPETPAKDWCAEIAHVPVAVRMTAMKYLITSR